MALLGSHNSKLTGLWEVDPAQATRIVSKAIVDNRGDVLAAAKAVGMSRATLWRWIKKYPALKRAVDQGRSLQALEDAKGK